MRALSYLSFFQISSSLCKSCLNGIVSWFPSIFSNQVSDDSSRHDLYIAMRSLLSQTLI